MPLFKKRTNRPSSLRNPYELSRPQGAPTLPDILPDDQLESNTDDRMGAISPNSHHQIPNDVTSISSAGTSQSYDSSSRRENSRERNRVQPYPYHMQPFTPNGHSPMPNTQHRQSSIHSYHTPRNEEVELLQRQSEWRAQLEIAILDSAERVWAAFKRAKKDKHAETGMDSPLYEATQCFIRDIKIPDKHRGCVRRDHDGIIRIMPPLSAKKQQKSDDEHKDRVKSHGEEHLDKLAKLYNVKGSNKYDKYAEAFTKHYATTRLMKPDPLRELSLFQWITMKMPKDFPGPPTLADIEWNQENKHPRYNETPYEWTSNGTAIPRADMNGVQSDRTSYHSNHSPDLNGYGGDRRMSYTPSVSSGASYHTAPTPNQRMSYPSMASNTTPGQRSFIGAQQPWEGPSDSGVTRPPEIASGYFPTVHMGGTFDPHDEQHYADGSHPIMPNPYDQPETADNSNTAQYLHHRGAYNYLS